MAVVAQLVEPRVVISVVVGSSPISRPIFYITYTSSIVKTTYASFGIFFRLHFMVFITLTIVFMLIIFVLATPYPLFSLILPTFLVYNY